jgi:membrane-associated PAP2 superfamily phosphatase
MDHSPDACTPDALALPSRVTTFPFDNEFWRTHAWWPLLAFVMVFATVELFSLDRSIAENWYFNVQTGRWLGSGPGDWWAHRLLHTGGGFLVRAIGAAAMVVWGLSFARVSLRAWRQPAGFVVVALLLSTAVIGGLKAITNVDCPWDLLGYGGDNPYVALFAHRPDALPQARCFPGAHASSGFALVCFYFLLRDRSLRLARWALAGAIVVGVAFSIGQEARGAHFFSHDLSSAAIVWFLQLALYSWMVARANRDNSE